MENGTQPITFQGVVLADWLAIAILLSTVVGIFVASYLAGSFENRHRKRNACDALIRELEDTETELTSSVNATERKIEGVYYKNAFLNREAYESIVHSGVFLEFVPTAQNTLSNFYANLKLRNELIIRIANYNEIFFLNNISQARQKEWNKAVLPYQLTVTHYELYIKNNLELLKQVIKDERPFSSLDVIRYIGYFITALFS